MDVKEMTMFQACMLHTRADKVLKNVVAKHLRQYDLTLKEWLLLYLICHNTDPAGTTLSSLAESLIVTLPQINALMGELATAKLAKQVVSKDDGRVRLVKATAKGENILDKIEVSMRQALREWLKDIPMPQLESYMFTVHHLANSNIS